MSTCTGCGAALPAEAKFCGVCGKAQAVMAGAVPHAPAVPPPMPAAPPPMPMMPQMTRGFSGAASGGGQSRQATIAGAPHDAFANASRIIGAKGGEFLWQQPPQSARFLLTYKNLWSTANISLKYDGDLQIAPGAPNQSTARIALKLQWGSAMPLLLLQGGSVMVAAMFNYYVAAFALILLIGFLAFTAWNASSNLPGRLLNDIMRSLQAGAPAAYPPPQPPAMAPPAPHHHAAAAAPAPPAAAPPSAAIAEQIKQLAALRDAGAITSDEFEAKKKELLSRI